MIITYTKIFWKIFEKNVLYLVFHSFNSMEDERFKEALSTVFVLALDKNFPGVPLFLVDDNNSGTLPLGWLMWWKLETAIIFHHFLFLAPLWIHSLGDAYCIFRCWKPIDVEIPARDTLWICRTCKSWFEAIQYFSPQIESFAFGWLNRFFCCWGTLLPKKVKSKHFDLWQEKFTVQKIWAYISYAQDIHMYGLLRLGREIFESIILFKALCLFLVLAV